MLEEAVEMPKKENPMIFDAISESLMLYEGEGWKEPLKNYEGLLLRGSKEAGFQPYCRELRGRQPPGVPCQGLSFQTMSHKMGSVRVSGPAILSLKSFNSP